MWSKKLVSLLSHARTRTQNSSSSAVLFISQCQSVVSKTFQLAFGDGVHFPPFLRVWYANKQKSFEKMNCFKSATKNTSLNPKKEFVSKTFGLYRSFIATYTHKSKDEDGFVDDALTRVSTRGTRRRDRRRTDDDDDDGGAFDFFERRRRRFRTDTNNAFLARTAAAARTTTREKRRRRRRRRRSQFGRAEANCRRAARRRHRKAVGGAVGGVTRLIDRGRGGRKRSARSQSMPSIAMQSHTGSGKTLAYLIPIFCDILREEEAMEKMDRNQKRHVNDARAAIVAPRRKSWPCKSRRTIETVLGPYGDITQQLIGGANARRQSKV